MSNAQKTSGYTLVATLHSGKSMDVSVAYRGENTQSNLHIINKIPLEDKHIDLFKKLYFSFHESEKPREFEKFFVSEKYFYSIFKYVKAENIKQKFNKNICTTPFDERCKLLEYILMKIDKISTLPPEILASIIRPENILIDFDRHIHILYNFQRVFDYTQDPKLAIFKNIGDIIFTMLQAESEAKYNKALHVVLGKCKKGVYSSIPQLIVDLKKAAQISKNSNWLSYIKYQISLRKPIIDKVTKVVTGIAVVIGIVILAYNQINTNNYSDATIKTVSIGDITYSSGEKDESDKNVSTEKSASTGNNKQKQDITLMPGLDMEYEDYIVQYGDNIASICNTYYKDSSYVNAVATFNGIDASEKLIPGVILKLPNRTAIALYISK
ncbi:MAG: hypothetical protein LBR79_00395 [Oscillospiraceae bacterium]|jgi:hypothetical protein|nr:hypothetical protein [Oscillospiraceae bacterium]